MGWQCRLFSRRVEPSGTRPTGRLVGLVPLGSTLPELDPPPPQKRDPSVGQFVQNTTPERFHQVESPSGDRSSARGAPLSRKQEKKPQTFIFSLQVGTSSRKIV